MFTGVILSNTQAVGRLLGVQQSEVQDVLNSYVSQCSSYINWVLIDAADSMYDDYDKSDWLSYASILNDYYIGLGLQNVSNCPLFIIGDENVIPMPTVENPRRTSGREYLYSDMLYCFDFQNGFKLVTLVKDKPRFAVGRLPLTDDFALENFQDYLGDCLTFSQTGIPVRGAVMTTTESWLRASKEMMRDIPVASLLEDYVPLNERMIVSPTLDTEYQEMYDGYVHELKKVDCLVCNLHGSPTHGEPYFIGQGRDSNVYTIATQPSMLEQTCPRIFNTVACYGARYTGYSLDDSMLLTAMVYGTMIYCGACDIALGGSDEYGNPREGNSELMMKLYTIYLHKGMPAGMALLKAKQDYYRTCHNEDGDTEAMYTILEFNLFGCPILSMQPKLSNEYQPILLGNRITQKQAVTYHPKIAKPIRNSAYQADDIHAYVRGLVDDNLSVIRQTVEKEVYQRLGLGRENLNVVYALMLDSKDFGYQFVYRWRPQGSFRQFEMFCYVETDNSGKITKIIHSK